MALAAFIGSPRRGRSNTIRLAAFVVLPLVLVVSAVPAARAEDKTAARDHWERGTKFYDLQKFDDAIREFEAAYEAKSDPAFLYNLAQSHRLAGHANDALRFYRTYLRYVPKAANRADIESHIKDLEKIVAEHPATEPSAPTSPSGSPALSPPAPSNSQNTAPPVAASGGSSSSGQSSGPSANAGWPAAGGTGSAPPPADFPAGATGTAYPVDSPPGSSPAVAPRSGRKTAGIAIAASGGGLFVVGAIFGLVAKNQSNKVETTADNGGSFDPSVESLGKTSQTLQWVGYVVGVAAIAAGAVLYLTAPAQYEAPPAPRVAVAPLAGPNLGGALVRVSF